MMLPWKRRSSGKGRRREKTPPADLVIPAEFRCPITLELMNDPVTLSTGITYDRESIETWMTAGSPVCPVTRTPISTPDPIPNHALRKMIQAWCVLHQSDGVDRIPTPRTPLTHSGAARIVAQIAAGDSSGAAAARLVSLGNESARNRACILASGAGRVLFESISSGRGRLAFNELQAIVWAMPLDEITLRSAPISTLHRLAESLTSEDDNTRKNAALILQQVVAINHNTESLATIEHICSTLGEQVKNQICSITSKASITIISRLLSSSKGRNVILPQVVQTGLLAPVLELLVDSDRIFSERILVVIEAITGVVAGREEACRNALTVPVVVKKILRVSDFVTELAISVMLNLVKFDSREVVEEALRVGLFQKLVVVLQVGCGDRTKERATELLKVLNLRRGGVVAVDSIGFMDLKSSFL